MKKIKNIGLWLATGFFAIMVLGTMPSFASILGVILILLLVPIEKIQSFFRKYIAGKTRIIAVVLLAVLMLATLPNENTIFDNSALPTEELTTPTEAPTETPTEAPTETPTEAPTEAPTETPTEAPTEPPHTHSFSAATCTTPKTCVCGATEGKAKGHSWQNATYASPKKCAVCGKTDGSPLKKPGAENYHGHVYTGGAYSKKFHYEAKCAGKNSHEITWEDVTRLGLEPCKTCVLK